MTPYRSQWQVSKDIFLRQRDASRRIDFVQWKGQRYLRRFDTLVQTHSDTVRNVHLPLHHEPLLDRFPAVYLDDARSRSIDSFVDVPRVPKTIVNRDRSKTIEEQKERRLDIVEALEQGARGVLLSFVVRLQWQVQTSVPVGIVVLGVSLVDPVR